MSFFQAMVACILPGSPVLSPISSRRASPLFEQRAQRMPKATLFSAPRHGSPLLVSSRLSSVTRTTPSDSDLSGAHHNLGLLLTKSMGLRNRFYEESYSAASSSDSLKHVHGSIGIRTLSPLALDFTDNQKDDEPVPCYPPGFARKTPPKVFWLPAPASPASPAESEETSDTAPAHSPPPKHPAPTTDSRPARSFAESIYIPVLQDYFTAPGTIGHEAAAPLSETGAASSRSTVPSFVQSAPNSWCSSAMADDGHVQEVLLEENRRETEREAVEEPSAAAPTPLRHPDGTEYHIIGKLGEGGFGRVMAAVSSKGELVALKVMHKPKVYTHDTGRENLSLERKLMAEAAEINAPYVVHLKAAWEQGDNVYFVMELCAEDLRTRLRRLAVSRETLPALEVKMLCAELILALVDLERLRIVHGDIKPDNILITKEGRIVLCDLGLGQQMPRIWPCNFDEWHAQDIGGTPGYYAPETLCQCIDGRAPESMSQKSDIFSMGLVLAELLCGLGGPLWDTVYDDPPEGIDQEQWMKMDDVQRQAARMMIEGLHNVLDSGWIENDDARDLVYQMLKPYPSQRPAPYELLRHRYFWDLNVGAVQYHMIPHPFKTAFQPRINMDVRDVAFKTWKRESGRLVKRKCRDTPLADFTWPEPKDSEVTDPGEQWGIPPGLQIVV
ncbi:kinase-like protein [Trametes cingulata]|nr:kinase-like protein [Trametes cingulata]